VPDAWGGLSRNGDDISVRDESGNIVDSIIYTDNDYEVRKGFSLERVSFSGAAQSASNWKLCRDLMGATPGFRNSASRAESSFSFAVSNRRIVPGCHNPFSHINMTLTAPAGGEFTLKIFDLKGRLVKSLHDREKNLAAGLETWDGRDSGGRIAPAGAYIVYCEYKSGTAHAVKKIPVALGGRCNDP
jgi:hypothetical protein